MKEIIRSIRTVDFPLVRVRLKNTLPWSKTSLYAN